MNKGQIKDEIISTVKNAINYSSLGDYGVPLHDNDVDNVAEDVAEEIYNLGYRKIFTSDLATEKQQAFKEGYERAKEELLESGELVTVEWHDEQVLHAENEIERLKRLNEDLETHSCNDRVTLKALSDELDKLHAQNEQLTKIIENIVNGKCNDNCKIAKAYVKEFAEKLKEECRNFYPSIDHYCCSEKAVTLADINELLKEYDNGN